MSALSRSPWMLLVLAALLLSTTPQVGAHLSGVPGSGGPYEEPPPSKDIQPPRTVTVCPNQHSEWREAQTVFGVEVQESQQCEPDNPKLVAASVLGTNNVPQPELDNMSLHEDAVVKGRDLDGDGDPDEINVTLEVNEINGWHLEGDVLGGDGHPIAPGIKPALWVFSPKSTINHAGDSFFDLVRLPSIPMRFEQGDKVRITLENTHYFPHTIHLHGVDHAFLDEDGEGNDGVPHLSEVPVKPGEARTYEFEARQPGTMFYHCHVQPQVHVTMGLSTIIIVEENRANNTVQTFNPGAGHVRHPSKAVREDYDREYDMVYQDYDKELGRIVQQHNDPREIAREQNRLYDATDRSMDYFLLNGRSFPYTLRESVVVVDEDERVKLRVINAGEESVSLHTHGHKTMATQADGVEIPEPSRLHRDVHTLSAAQRLDLVLNTTNDGLNSYGPGIWFTHDHHEKAVTTDGIGPGGDITVIAYEGWLDNDTAMPIPQGADSWNLFFSAAYYDGRIPVWSGLGLDSFLGEVATAPDDPPRTGPEHTNQGNMLPVPAPGASIGLALALIAALGWAIRRKEVRG